ncbi:hypothetical protein KEM55_001440, partial [Ascosphaera atra]
MVREMIADPETDRIFQEAFEREMKEERLERMYKDECKRCGVQYLAPWKRWQIVRYRERDQRKAKEKRDALRAEGYEVESEEEDPDVEMEGDDMAGCMSRVDAYLEWLEHPPFKEKVRRRVVGCWDWVVGKVEPLREGTVKHIPNAVPCVLSLAGGLVDAQVRLLAAVYTATVVRRRHGGLGKAAATLLGNETKIPLGRPSGIPPSSLIVPLMALE